MFRRSLAILWVAVAMTGIMIFAYAINLTRF